MVLGWIWDGIWDEFGWFWGGLGSKGRLGKGKVGKGREGKERGGKGTGKDAHRLLSLPGPGWGDLAGP